MPTQVAQNAGYLTFPDAVDACQCLACDASTGKRAQVQNVGRGEFCGGVAFPVGRRASSPLGSVAIVIGGGTEAQMGGVTTGGVVTTGARVEYPQAFRNGAVCDSPYQAMDFPKRVVNPYGPVAEGRGVAGPDVALAHGDDAGPDAGYVDGAKLLLHRTPKSVLPAPGRLNGAGAPLYFTQDGAVCRRTQEV